MLFVVVLYGPVLLLTILVHEFGHVFATKRQGGEVGGVVLWVSKIHSYMYLYTLHVYDMWVICHQVSRSLWIADLR